MSGRKEVVRLVSALGSGTGFLISHRHLVTACHVILPFDCDELLQPVACEFADGSLIRTDRIVAYDHTGDWAVLDLESPGGAYIHRLHRNQLGHEGKPWTCYGFPPTHSNEGAALTGHVASEEAPRATRHGVGLLGNSLQLYSHQAAASQPQPIPGFSGAPVVVDGRVLGIIREFRGSPESGIALGGTIDATYIAAVLAGLDAAGLPFGLLDEIREQHPEVFKTTRVFGDLDDMGRLVEKNTEARAALALFLEANRNAECIVARELWEQLPDPKPNPGRGLAALLYAGDRPRRRCVPTHNLDVLLARLGLADVERPLTSLFSSIRSAAATATDWRGRQIDLANLHEPSLKPLGTEDVYSLSDLARVATSGRLWTIEGRPGAGKSVLLRRLHHILWTTLPRRGPSVLLEARRCRGLSLAQVLAHAWPDHALCLELLLEHDSPANEVWLLIDGLDELPASDRLALIAQARRWPGPCVISTRQLPEADRGDRRLVVEDLSLSFAVSMLEQEGASETLVDLVRGFSPSWRPGPKPARQAMIEELLSTPLGVSMLACVDDINVESRASLLHGLMLQELQRAAEADRISKPIQARFHRYGFDVLGVMAWSMLRQQRTTLTADDFAWAEQHLRLPVEAMDDLQCAIQDLGFVEIVGPGQWEFSHKTFSEHCAAQAIARGKVEWEPLLVAVGEPAINEITINLGGVAEWATRVISRLLQETERPFTALSLATRVAREAVAGTIAGPVLCELVRRQVALATRFPAENSGSDSVLPGGAGSFDALEPVLVRHRAVLSSYRLEIAAACVAPVRDWLLRRTMPAASAESRAYSRYCAALADLGYDLELEDWLRLPLGEQHLVERGRGDWARGLWVLREHDDESVASRAQSIWFACAPQRDLLDHLDLLGVDSQSTILEALVECGSLPQVREGLLRAETKLVAVAEQLGGLEMDDLWRAAWDAGSLGRSHFGSRGHIARLYSRLLDDPHPLARWRALLAHSERGFGSKIEALSPELLRRFAIDENIYIRIESLHQLGERNLATTDAIIISLTSPLDDERWVAWSAWLASGATPSFEATFFAACSWTSHRPTSSHDAVELPVTHETRSRVDSARHSLTRWLGERVNGGTEIDVIRRGLMHSIYHSTASAVLSSLKRESSSSLVLGGPTEIRRALVSRLYSMDQSLLRQLTDDPDPEVAEAARRQVYRDRDPPLEIARAAVAPIRAPDEDALFLIGANDAGHADVPHAPVITIQALLKIGEFVEIWQALGTTAIRWSSLKDTEGYLADKDWDSQFESLMREAGGMNQEAVRPLLGHLDRLYTAVHRSRVVKALGEAQRGYFAMHLLAKDGPAQDVVEAIAADPRASLRAARLLTGTEFARAAAQRFADLVLSGQLHFDLGEAPDPIDWPTRTGFYYLDKSATWLGALFELGGVEAIWSLAERACGLLRDLTFKYLSRAIHRRGRQPRPQIDRRIRDAMRGLGSDESLMCQVAALQILTILGDAHDADSWLPRVRTREVPHPVWLAALVLVGAHRANESCELLIEIVEHTDDVHTRDAALLGLSFVIDQPDLASRAVRWLELPLGRSSFWSSRFGTGWEHAVARLVLNNGDRSQAWDFALASADKHWLLDVVEMHFDMESPRVLPEHGLLVLGAVRSADYHDPDREPDEPERARRVLSLLCEHVEAAEVRRCYIRMLAETDVMGWQEERDLLEPLGGIQAEDSSVFVAMLERDPLDARALGYLAKCNGAGERELARSWERRVSWWLPAGPSIRAPDVGR